MRLVQRRLPDAMYRRGKTLPETGTSSIRGVNQMRKARRRGIVRYVRRGRRTVRSRASWAKTASSSG